MEVMDLSEPDSGLGALRELEWGQGSGPPTMVQESGSERP